MSFACSILYHLIPVDAPGPDKIMAIARRKGWPCAVEASGRIGLEPIAGTDEFTIHNLADRIRRWARRRQRRRYAVRLLKSWIRGEAFHITAIYGDGHRERVTIPDGERSDMGSIPRLLRAIPEGTPTRWPITYGTHDRIYGVRRYDSGKPIGLEEADWLLLMLLIYEGCPDRERTVIYRYLRLGSWWVWYHVGDKLTLRGLWARGRSPRG